MPEVDFPAGLATDPRGPRRRRRHRPAAGLPAADPARSACSTAPRCSRRRTTTPRTSSSSASASRSSTALSDQLGHPVRLAVTVDPDRAADPGAGGDQGALPGSSATTPRAAGHAARTALRRHARRRRPRRRPTDSPRRGARRPRRVAGDGRRPGGAPELPRAQPRTSTPTVALAARPGIGRGPGGRPSPRAGPAQPEVHLRHLRHRREQPVRPRGGRRGRRGAGQGLQPAVRLRRVRAGQDPPAARHRALRAQPLPQRAGALRELRGVHQRLHQQHPRRQGERASSAATATSTCC